MKAKLDAQSQIPTPPVPLLAPMAPPSVVSNNEVSPQTQIEELAYKLFEERGRADGHDQQDWFEAESILCTGKAPDLSSVTVFLHGLKVQETRLKQ